MEGGHFQEKGARPGGSILRPAGHTKWGEPSLRGGAPEGSWSGEERPWKASWVVLSYGVDFIAKSLP